MLAKYSEIEYQALHAKVTLSGGEVPFTMEEFKEYIRALVYSRVAWVNSLKYVVHPNEPIAVPAFLSVVLMNIGNAEEVSLGLRLVPEIKGMFHIVEKGEGNNKEKVWEVKPFNIIEKDLKLANKDLMQKISNYLKAIEGYEYGKGYLKDKSGTFDFMSMQVVDSYITHHEAQAHPVYALLASILQPHLVASALSPLVRYGSVEFLKGLLWEVTAI
jgi:hypothetical protein